MSELEVQPYISNAVAVDFYGVDKVSKYKALTQLLLKTLETKQKAVVFSKNDSELLKLDDMLWIATTWLPHGLDVDKYPEQQAILLSSNMSSWAGNPAYIFLIDDTEITDELVNYPHAKRIFFIFDLTSLKEVELARSRWSTFKNLNTQKNTNQEIKFELKYHKQNKEGKFELVSM